MNATKFCIAMLSLAITGCAHQQAPTFVLDDHFEGGSVLIQHWQYYVKSELRDPRERDVVVKALTRYVRGEDPHIVTRLGHGDDVITQLKPQIRPKDYWALVLADLLNRELILFGYDSDGERDRKIQAMLLPPPPRSP
jgi:hypothetical protein